MENLRTPRGTLKITAVFQSQQEADAQGYGYYFSHDKWDIYIKHKNTYSVEFAVIERT